MPILTRRMGETLMIGNDVTVSPWGEGQRCASVSIPPTAPTESVGLHLDDNHTS